ncbi:MAG: class E sortase [Patescibacteria group bacterium]
MILSGFRKKKTDRWPFLEWIITLAILMVAAGAALLILQVMQRSSEHGSTVTVNGNLVTTVNGNSNTAPTPPKVVLKRGDPDHLSIPDRKIEAPIVYTDKTDEPSFQEALTRGVVHYPGTALPGEYGNPYIFGHSSDYFWKPGDFKQVLKPLVDVPIGTVVNITDNAGALFVYKVIETRIVGPKDVSVLDQGDGTRRLLTLQTSWPIGTALKRYVALCELDEPATYGP